MIQSSTHPVLKTVLLSALFLMAAMADAQVMEIPIDVLEGDTIADGDTIPEVPRYRTLSAAELSTVLCRIPVKDIRQQVDYGHDSLLYDRRQIDMVVVHSNYFVGGNVFSTKGCIDQFRQYDVAPHYMITRDGTILYMVDERLVAWHAGQSLLPGTDRDSLNYTSIGIELVAHPSQPITQRQNEQLLRLVTDIRKRYPIRYLMRHSDIARRRKTDPWSINWPRFVRNVIARTGEVIWRK